jgi:chorismate dehydratase
MHACLPGFQFAYDLGEEWTAWTELPFVFAGWAMRPGVVLGETEHAFHEAKRRGIANAGAIAAVEADRLHLGAGFCRRYLTNVIRYDLGPREQAGLDHFAKLAAELELIPRGIFRDHRHDFIESR